VPSRLLLLLLARHQATHGIRSEVDSQHHVLDRMVRPGGLGPTA